MKRFVVNKIVAPFGPPIDERPPVPTPEEREATDAVKREAKVARRELRKSRERLEGLFNKSDRRLQMMLEETTRVSTALRERLATMSLDWGQGNNSRR